MNDKYKALVALVLATILFASVVIVSRATVEEISPMLILFLRMISASIIAVPYIIVKGLWRRKHIISLTGISILAAINPTFFIWSIQYTSASASQIIYSIQPLLTIIVSNYIFGKKYPFSSFVGVVIGLIGILMIIVQSAIERGQTISGSLQGNIGLIFGMLGWFWFILLSKRLTKYFSPFEISSVAIFITLILSIFMLSGQILFTSVTTHLTYTGVAVGIYLGIFGTIFTYVLTQYAIKYLTPLTVNLSSYLQPIIVTILAIILLNERITAGFLGGSMLVISGLFLSSFFEIYRRKRLNINSQR